MGNVEPVEGILLDLVPNRSIAASSCTNRDVALVEDPFAADVHNTPGQHVWACPPCLADHADAI
jgi:hypothetical protein